MSSVKTIVLLLSATAFVVSAATPSSAFSQLGREDGSLPEQGNVVSAPLPPLSGGTQGADEGAKQTGTASGGAPDDASSSPVAPETQDQSDPGPATETATPADDDDAPAAAPGDGSAPTPGAATPLQPNITPTDPSAGTAAPADPNTDDEEGTDPAASQQATPEEPQGPPPDVVYGDSQLPAPVRDLRAKLIEIAKFGDIEKLRPYIEPGEDGTVLSFGGVEGDPIEYLKSSSGDGDGVETLAILLEVLQAGHVRNEANTDNEIYVWPYFSSLSIGKLTKPQKVELFELVTAGDYQEMVGFGAYNFYRVGISPDGKLQFFVAGD